MISVYGGASSPSYKQVSLSGVQDGQRHQVLAVYSRTDSKMYAYVDGVLQGSGTWDGYMELQEYAPKI